MKLLNGINHLTFITSYMDKLIDFYKRMFDAEVTLDLEQNGIRHAFIEVRPNTVLHPFQIPKIEPPDILPMFSRGRLDHCALNASSMEAFIELQKRLSAEDCVEGNVIDMGMLLLFNFIDPDKGQHEVVLWKEGRPTDGVLRKDWKDFEMEV